MTVDLQLSIEAAFKRFTDFNHTVLDLSNLALTSIPELLYAQNSVEYVILDNNYIEVLPKELFNLRKLKVLSARNNRIRALDESIGNLHNLERLYLSNNELEILPRRIGLLRSLRKLELSNNRLMHLPEALGKLSNLSELHLHNNMLSSLPISLSGLQKLITNQNSVYARGLTVDGNNFGIGKEVYTLDPKDIISEVLRIQGSKRSGRLKKVNEGKIIFIGESNYGKTHLIEMLVSGKIDRDISTTHGIEKRYCVFSQGSDPIKGNIWDLGGQEFMRSTHQFFFTEATLYVLVTLARRERSELNYWLQLVRVLGGNAPVLVIIHQTDKDSHDLDRHSLQRDYSNIVGFERTSIYDLDSIHKLRGRIEDVLRDSKLMPGVHQERPEEWFRIKKRLESTEKDFISYENYEAICRKEAPNFDSQARKTTLKIFNALGIVISFVDDARLIDTNVINPDWITKGVYGLINDSTIKNTFKGRFNLSDLSRILDNDLFPIQKHPYIIDIMEKFKICYSIPNRDQQYIIPDLLEDIEAHSLELGEPALEFSVDYGNFVCHIIMTHLIVNLHDHIYQDCVWRSGVIVRINDNICRIGMPFTKNSIDIAIYGSTMTAREALTYIRHQIKRIHQSYEGLNAIEEVVYKKHKIPYESLLIHERDGKLLYHPYLREDLHPTTVLNGFTPQQLRNLEVDHMNGGKYNIKAEQVIINEGSNLGTQVNRLQQQAHLNTLSTDQKDAIAKLLEFVKTNGDVDERSKTQVVEQVNQNVLESPENKNKAMELIKDIGGKITASVAGALLTKLAANALGLS